MSSVSPLSTTHSLLAIHTMEKSRWSFLKTLGMSLGVGWVLSLSNALPVRATGFLDLSTWSGASTCMEGTESSCVATAPADGVDYAIFGPDSEGTYIITSTPATESTYIDFTYSFEPGSVFAVAEYSPDGTTFTPLNTAQSSSPDPILLSSGNSFRFRLTNTGEQPILSLSNLTSTPVPAPLPALGSAAAFGAIRRRRATLRLRQSFATRAACRRQ